MPQECLHDQCWHSWSIQDESNRETGDIGFEDLKVGWDSCSDTDSCRT